MLKEDELKWKRPYTGVVDGPAEPRLSAHTDIPLGSCTQLGDEILSDLSPEVLGVAWWHEHLPAAPRILISDHLLACARAIPQNLLEAQVGLLDFREAASEHDELMQRGVRNSGDFRYPTPRGPYDDLIPVWEQAAVAGMVRALGSALDCLGACIVGVAGLPTDILRADLGTARTAMKKASRSGAQDWQDLASSLEAAIADAGPDGWLEWLVATRNTVVHRGRRVTAMNGEVDRSTKARRPRMNLVRVLNADPSLTEVAAWQANAGYFSTLLSEPAETTLHGCLQSTAKTIESVCTHLQDLWRLRREHPERLRQPANQWTKEKAPGAQDKFQGYAPDPSLLQGVDSVGVADETGMRLAAAGLSRGGKLRP